MSAPAPASTLAVELTPDEQHRLEEASTRRARNLDRRERWAEVLVGGGFVAAAGALLSIGAPAMPWGTLALLVVVFAVLARVRFDVGAGFTVPTQLILMPMVVLLPPQLVPAAAAAGFVLSGVPDALAGRIPPGRLALRLADSWFAVGPAAVMLLAGTEPGAIAAWWVYVAAVLAQLAADYGMSCLRDVIHGEADPRQQLLEARWGYTVHALLAPVRLL